MTESADLVIQPAGHNAVQQALYLAISWNEDPLIPPLDIAIRHPEIARYHLGWGRRGDVAVEAILDGEFVGAAFARLFTDEEHGHGYLGPDTPELGIGVAKGHRGRGIGRRLMVELAAAARAEGQRRLSLSVNNPNPARRLYESLGYTIVGDDGDSTVMVLDL